MPSLGNMTILSGFAFIYANKKPTRESVLHSGVLRLLRKKVENVGIVEEVIQVFIKILLC